MDLNPPAVSKILVKGSPMVGYPLVPIVLLRRADDSRSRFQWFRSQDGISWTAVSEGKSLLYTPMYVSAELKFVA